MKFHAIFLALMIPAVSAHAEAKPIPIPHDRPDSMRWWKKAAAPKSASWSPDVRVCWV